MKKVFVDGIDIHVEDAKYDIRIVLKSENKSHKNFGTPVFFRFKERKTFRYRNFIYFFTKIWEGKDIKDVCSSKAKYEIEIECDVSAEIGYLTRALIYKCKDLIGVPDDFYSMSDLLKRSNKSSYNHYRKRPRKEISTNSYQEIPQGKQEEVKLDENFFKGVQDLYQRLIVQNNFQQQYPFVPQYF